MPTPNVLSFVPARRRRPVSAQVKQTQALLSTLDRTDHEGFTLVDKIVRDFLGTPTDHDPLKFPRRRRRMVKVTITDDAVTRMIQVLEERIVTEERASARVLRDHDWRKV